MPNHSAMGKPPYSANAEYLLQSAELEARRRHHRLVGTEHLVLAIVNAGSVRVLPWIAGVTCPELDIDQAILRFQEDVRSYLHGRKWFNIATTSDLALCEEDSVTPIFSPTLRTVLQIAESIGSRTVLDGDTVYPDGLVTSEFLLAAVLVEGTGLGAQTLVYKSRGKVNSHAILTAIHVPPEDILIPQSSDAPWNYKRLDSSGNFCSIELRAEPSNANIALLDIPLSRDILIGVPPPTENSNWVIPHRLLIGEYPSPKDALNLIDKGGVNVFVCLIGEFSPASYLNAKYPNDIRLYYYNTKSEADVAESKNNVQRQNNVVPCSLEFLHFPIRVFEVAEIESVIMLVNELKRRIIDGDTIFIHCRGGHG